MIQHTWPVGEFSAFEKRRSAPTGRRVSLHGKNGTGAWQLKKPRCSKLWLHRELQGVGACKNHFDMRLQPYVYRTDEDDCRLLHLVKVCDKARAHERQAAAKEQRTSQEGVALVRGNCSEQWRNAFVATWVCCPTLHCVREMLWRRLASNTSVRLDALSHGSNPCSTLLRLLPCWA